MARRRLLLTFCFGAWIACSDGTGPPEPGESPGRTDHRVQLHELRWKPTEQPRVFDAKGDVELVNAYLSAGAGGIASFTVSFWAVKGDDRSIQIVYSDDDGSSQALMVFAVPANGLRAGPDGTTFVGGDSVLITVTFDTDQFLAQFRPAGLQFNPNQPAVLEYWYAGADEDLDGDGDVDADDDYIESNLLDLWYRGDGLDFWSQLTATHDLQNKLYRLDIEHFSSYAVSW